MIVIIDDDKMKYRMLKVSLRPLRSTVISEINPLTDFLRNRRANGIAVVDVGRFHCYGPDEMYAIGHSLSERGWKIIFWSTLADADLINEECWVFKGGVREIDKIAGAIREINGSGNTRRLERGKLPSGHEVILQLLSALFLFGLVWEVERKKQKGENKPVTLKDIATKITEENFSGFEARIVKSLKALISNGRNSQWEKDDKISIQKINKKLNGKTLDKILEEMASCNDIQKWNETLKNLRDALLS